MMSRAPVEISEMRNFGHFWGGTSQTSLILFAAGRNFIWSSPGQTGLVGPPARPRKNSLDLFKTSQHIGRL